MARERSLNRRDRSMKAKDASLPPIGSYDLISDLVRTYTDISKKDKVEKSKLHSDSLRLYPGSRISRHKAAAGRTLDEERRRSQSMAAWGTETLNKKTCLFRPKGLRDDDGTQGRFLTSTKP